MNSVVNIESLLKSHFSGYSFRSRIEHDVEGKVQVIQMKDVNSGTNSISATLDRIQSDMIPKRHLLKKGDILFMSKGANNKAVVFTDDTNPTIAVSAFYVLRCDPAQVFPEYLAWYINEREAQQYLMDTRAGTYVPNVSKATILAMPVRVPEKKIQENISKIDFLQKREYLLMSRLLEARKVLVSSKLFKAL